MCFGGGMGGGQQQGGMLGQLASMMPPQTVVTPQSFFRPFVPGSGPQANGGQQSGSFSPYVPGSFGSSGTGGAQLPGMQTPGMLAALQAGQHSQTGMGRLAGMGLGALSSAGAGAALGSIVPGIGTVIGGLVGAFAPSLFKTNASAIQDIAGAGAHGMPVSDQSWNQAGYGPNGSYLDPQALLTKAPGQKNNAPIRDIAQAISLGRPVSDASWAMAGLPAGGGTYGQQLMAALGARRTG